MGQDNGKRDERHARDMAARAETVARVFGIAEEPEDGRCVDCGAPAVETPGGFARHSSFCAACSARRDAKTARAFGGGK